MHLHGNAAQMLPESLHHFAILEKTGRSDLAAVHEANLVEGNVSVDQQYCLLTGTE